MSGVENASVLSHCSFLRNPCPKPAGVPEHCHEGETNCWFSIFRGASFLTASLKATKNVTVRKFPLYCNSYKLYQRITETL